MPRITRKAQKQFAGGITAPGNIEVFGSTAAGGAVYSNDPDAIQSAAFLLGWNAATIGDGSPVIQDRNAMDFLFAYQTAYLLQQGLAEWNGQTTYFTNNFCAVDGVIYISKTDDNLNNAVTDSNNWKTLASTLGIPTVPAAALASAWINFDGTTATGFQALNVSGIVRNSTGNYTVHFARNFAIQPVFAGNSPGFTRPIAAAGDGSSFTFDTAALVGGAAIPHDYPYVSAIFYGALVP